MACPPDLDAGEITDKGFINQRRVLAHQAALIHLLYTDPRLPASSSRGAALDAARAQRRGKERATMTARARRLADRLPRSGRLGQTAIHDLASGERLTYAEFDDDSSDRRRRKDSAECHVLAAGALPRRSATINT